MTDFRVWLAAGMAMGSAGCATVPPPRLTADGQFPPPGAYTLAPPPPGALDGSAEPALRRCLAERGLSPASGGTAPYRVIITASQRTGAVGLSNAQRDPLPIITPLPTKLKPWPGRATIEALGLAINASSNGHDLFRAQVSRITPRPNGPPATPLADILCGIIPPR